MFLAVHLDDVLFGCCGPALVVGAPIAWPLNFSIAESPDDLAHDYTGTIEHCTFGPAHSGPGCLFWTGGASLYLPGSDRVPGPATLRGTVHYIDHGYVPEHWPDTCGVVRSIRAGDGSMHHTWDRVAGGQLRRAASARADTVVTVDID